MVSILENHKYLKFSNFKILKFWDYYSLSIKSEIYSDYPLVELSDILVQRNDYIIIDNTKLYKRCRVKVRGQGIVLRDEVLGKEIKTKKQYLCKKDDFLVAEIDAKVGGYGIVPKELVNSIVSSHYFLFEIDKSKLNPEYLSILTKCEGFSKQVKATGSTNYAAIRPSHVLEYLIPLPSLNEQERILAQYSKKIALAEKQKNEAIQLEIELENYLFEVLGIEKLEEKENIKGLQFVNLKNLDRWDVLAKDLRTLNGLSTSKYDLKKLGNVFSFPSKPWKKKEFTKNTFRYIELGAIDENFGITEVKEVELKKAPSRATQQVNSGDLIIGTTRPYLKRFAIVTEEYDGDICSSGFSIIEPSPSYDLNYLKAFLMSFYGIEQLKNRMTGGTYPAITNSELKEILIPFPNPKIQLIIGNHILNLKEQIKNLKNLAEENEKKAIIEFEQEIFTPV